MPTFPKRPSLYLLPITFTAILLCIFLFSGKISSWLDKMEVSIQFLSILLVLLFLSATAFFWLFAIISGRPAASAWKPVLILHLAVIFPGAVLEDIAFYIIDLSNHWRIPWLMEFVWAAIAFVLVLWALWLFRTRSFAPYAGDRFWPWQFFLVCVGGAAVFFNSGFLFSALFFI